MIPINLAIIGAGAQGGSRSRGFLLGGVYGAAMALVYGLLGVIVITHGQHVRHDQRLALVQPRDRDRLCRCWRWRCSTSSRSTSRASPGRSAPASGNRGSLALAFGMGAMAALLAGACVAPVVIQVVLFSSDLYAQGTLLALGLPFLLGIGMAIPWPIAGAGLTALPKPGAWMVRVKQAFGVLILATAAYYGYLAYGLFADRWVDAKEVTSSVEEKLKAGWHASLAEGLDVAHARAEAGARGHVGDVVQELPGDGSRPRSPIPR